jgi:ADP-dependent phosphofructokinase/glucokinase
MGNLMSATRARIGRYGDRTECAETLSLPLSPKGLRIREEVLERETAGAEDDILCIVVPTRLMERPKYTIGLGDTVVAGVQTAFLG